MPLAKALGVTTDYLLCITQDQEQEQTQTANTAAGLGVQETPQTNGPRCYTGQTDAKPPKHADRPAERFSFRSFAIFSARLLSFIKVILLSCPFCDFSIAECQWKA